LTKGSQLRRYEVLLRSKSEDAPNAAPQAMLKAAVESGLGSMIDRRVLTQLIAWLVHHPEVWKTQAVHVLREPHEHRAARRALHQIRRVVLGEVVAAEIDDRV
jgi:EAL domain-containing protein (putative c-di-GMP-specific phosphodiesterase class I)